MREEKGKREKRRLQTALGRTAPTLDAPVHLGSHATLEIFETRKDG